jgi:hypothetical protein
LWGEISWTRGSNVVPEASRGEAKERAIWCLRWWPFADWYHTYSPWQPSAFETPNWHSSILARPDQALLVLLLPRAVLKYGKDMKKEQNRFLLIMHLYCFSRIASSSTVPIW